VDPTKQIEMFRPQCQSFRIFVCTWLDGPFIFTTKTPSAWLLD